jgi:hypothetical protein
MMNPTVPREGKQKLRPRSLKPQPEAAPTGRRPAQPPVSSYELYCERGYRHGYALDDWLDAEREILSQVPPV